MHANKLMTHPVITCKASDTLAAAANLMWDHDCGILPAVGPDGRVAGIITDRDICMAAFTQGRSLDEITVSHVMAIDAITVKPNDKLGHVEELMVKHQLRRLPVVDENDHPIGMISLSDLAIECARTDTEMKHGPSKIAHTLAAISRPRTRSQEVA